MFDLDEYIYYFKVLLSFNPFEFQWNKKIKITVYLCSFMLKKYVIQTFKSIRCKIICWVIYQIVRRTKSMLFINQISYAIKKNLYV